MRRTCCKGCQFFSKGYCELLDCEVGDINDPDCNYHDDITDL